MIYEEGGGGCRSWALVACGWGSSLAVSARHSLVGDSRIRGRSSFVCGGLSSSVGRVVAAVPGCCLLWVLGRFLWAQGHLVEGGQAVVHGRRLVVVIVCAGSSWALGRCSWILGCGLWAVGLVCGMSYSWVAGGCLWMGCHGQVARGLGCGLWARWCHVVCCVLMVSEIGWDEWGQGTHCYS